jgi:hypothetical protein
MCTVIIIAALITVSCPEKVTPAEALQILATAPGLSNRTNAQSVPEQPRVVFFPSTPTSAPKPIEPRRLDGTPLSQPPQVYGIPYPWTPLTWAILHSGGNVGGR